MKTTITKKLLACLPVSLAFILLISGMFSFTLANAQCVCYCTSNGQPRFHALCYTKPNGNLGCRHDGGRPDCRVGNSTSTPNSSALEDIYPNPVSTSATVSFYLGKTENVSLKIFDVSGRWIATLANAFFEEGDHEIMWNASDVNSGIYFLRMETATFSENRKLIVSK